MNGFKWVSKRNETTRMPGEAVRDPSGILRISCDGCERSPDACEPECLKCMTDAVHRAGASERIRMTGTKDIEVTGRAAEAICLLSDAVHMNVCDPRDPGCRDCECRPSMMAEALWSTFPEPSFQAAKQVIRREKTDDPGCASCLQRTSALLLNAEVQMERIRSCLGGEGR